MDENYSSAGSSPADNPSSTPAPELDFASYRSQANARDVSSKAGRTAAPAEEPKQPKAESAPAKEEPSTERPGAEPETRQEPRKPKNSAETRLQELLDNLKNAGLSPSELKTFKKQAQQQQTETTKSEASQPKSEPTAKPAAEAPGAPKAPTKPKIEEFPTLEAYEDARDKYIEELADYRAELKLRERDERDRVAKAQAELDRRIAAARERYGAEEANRSIGQAAREIFQDETIPRAVKELLNESDVIEHVLYTLGSKSDDLKSFVGLAKANPGKAVRQLVLIERLVADELAKPSVSDEGESTPTRDDSGKFVSSKTEPPAKKTTQAPPPPREVSGRSAAPPDAIESAAKANDFSAYREAANRRDLARFTGR